MGVSTTSGDSYIDFAMSDPGATSPSGKMRLNSAGTLLIGTSICTSEANLILGAKGSLEGGQLVLQKGTSCACATHLDNYQNTFRIMSGTDTGSTTVNMAINHTNGNACFLGNVQAFGYQSFKGSISLTASQTAAIYTMPQASAADGVYYVYVRLNGGAAIYMASAIVTALAASSEIFISNTRTGANVGLSVSGRDIRITNAGFGTFTWQWSILFQPVD
jgi:hypothetical protein